MNLMLGKIWAVARMELRLAWRRRALPVVTVFLALALIGFLILVPEPSSGDVVLVDDTTSPATVIRIDPATGELMQQPASAEELAAIPPAMHNQRLDVLANSLQMITFATVIFPVLVGVTLVLVFAETLALDRQHRVRELLDAVPLPPGAYLAGKLIGVWLGVLLALAAVVAVFLISARLLLGLFDVGQVLAGWLAMTVPFSLISSGLGLLSAARAGTRRRAIVIGLLVIPCVLLLFTLWYIGFWTDLLAFLSTGAASTQLSFNQLFVSTVGSTGRIAWACVLIVPALWMLQTGWARWRA